MSKGETVFQLSRRYNVSPQDIFDLNPSSVNVIKIGEVLLIPKNENQPTATLPSNTSSNPSNTITYAVLSGDTKYSLARKYGISVEELERQNPHIIKGLQAGHILKIQGQQNKSALSSDYTIKKTHLVLKGQTLWGISKANGLTVEQLVNANSDILTGILQIGQVLKIPNLYNTSTGDSENTYLVQRGDTKYGLSKKYGVSIAELEQANPHIVKMLMAGHTIRIPQDSQLAENDTLDKEATKEQENVSEEIPNVETVEATNPNNEITENPATESTTSFVDYEIQPKETLYGLSKKAGMSISDFVALNPQLTNGAKVGMMVKMPTTTVNQLPTSIDQPSTKKSNQRYVDLSQSINAIKKNQVLLFLPFSEAQFNDQYSRDINFKDVSDEFIKNHLEFYRGAKIAQDSAKALGLDFNVKIVETNTSKRNTKAAALAKETNLENYDAVLAPFYENDIQEIASVAKEKGIPIVTTSSIIEEQGYKNIYNGVPSVNAKRNIMLDYMKSKEGNLIVICDVARKESKSYISSYAPTTVFVEVNKKGIFNADELTSQLDKNKVNYVILESEKNGVFLSTTNLLLGQLSNYSIQLALLDDSLIPNTSDVSKKRFVILQMLYPSLTAINESPLSIDFVEAYKKAYSVGPPQNVKFGFDLTFDTLLRMSQAKSFEASAENDITEYTNLMFDYKLNTLGNHDNYGIYIIQYNPDGSLKEIK
ncbi:MAG: LysM peptidoglycan-binding domain-containing protein [Gelidibacter sp.]